MVETKPPRSYLAPYGSHRKIHVQARDLWSVSYHLVGDLFIWHGFLAGRMDAYLKPMPGPPGDNSERIAEAYGEPLTANQLNRRIAELGILRQPAGHETA